MESTTIKLTLAGLLGATLLGGCAMDTPRLDAHFGEAVNMAIAKQTINPDAGSNPDPAAGIGGEAARGTMDRYIGSYQKPPAPANVFTIGVGSGGGAMGGGGSGGAAR